MTKPDLTSGGRNASRLRMERGWKAGVGVALAATLPACVNVAAPERPIEINLTITIRQEVVVRLQRDAQELIQNNPGVF